MGLIQDAQAVQKQYIMSLALPIMAALSDYPDTIEVLKFVVAPGFLRVVVVLGILALLTRAIGMFFASQVQGSGHAVDAPSSLSAREYAVVAAAVHAVMRTPNDLGKVASAAAIVYEAKQNKTVRIVSIEKKV